MNRFLIIATTALAFGCANDPEVPPAESQSAVTRDVEQPTTVTGCLKAGDAADTYVLTTAQTVDGTPAATYHLTGADNVRVNLQDHVGSRVEATGVVEQQSEIASRQPAQPADEARGTSGMKPSVQTGTELSIRRMNVTAVRPVGGECEL